jgi:DNA-binding MarR family transcriptional regulator/GNAT superfamily N-acetyltransferase
MQEALVAEVRRFNRTVTAHIGALDDRYLGLGRPLGEARLLWEIGPEGCELRALRSRLDLDSGYLSRLLRRLEGAGLVTVGPNEADRRSRVVRLTPAGLAERSAIDRRGDELAWSLLQPLSAAQQEELITAMRKVDRLLTAGIVEIRAVDPTHADARRCIDEYFAELDRRSESGFDPAASASAEPHELRPPAGVFLLAYLRGEPVGCGGLKHHADATSEIKRLWVADSARGLGIGRRLLAELEDRASRHGARAVRLDTNRNLTEAIAMYRGTGYVEIPPFNHNPFAHHWFEKDLGGR